MPSLRDALAAAAALVAFFAIEAAASAHGMRTAYLEVVELEPGRALVHFRLPASGGSAAPELPPECDVTSAGEAGASQQSPRALASPSGLAGEGASFLLRCPASLAGLTISVTGLGPLVNETVVRVSLADGTTSSHLLTVGAPSAQLPRAPRPLASFADHVKLGLWHILEGADHLLFLLLLVLTLRRARAVIAAETAFTLSHSLSFSAAALGWIDVSPQAAEACIALSLVLLALDVERRGAPSAQGEGSPAASARAGAATALLFGLVHGLGFAGGLREAGLPEHDIGWALLGFGAGVELGQVAFLAVALGAAHLLSKSRYYPRVALAAAYSAGVVATFWLIERLLECVKYA